MGRQGGALSSIRVFDAFSRPLEDVRIRSSSGALITLGSFLLIFFLTVGSWIDYRRVILDHNLEVDRSRGEKLSVNVDVTFPRVPCYLLSIDVMDISGEHVDDVKHDIDRTRLDQSGKVLDVTKGESSSSGQGNVRTLSRRRSMVLHRPSSLFLPSQVSKEKQTS